MAIKIYDAGGNDLLANAPVEVTYQIASGTYNVGIYAEIVEDDTCLPYQLLRAELDWNDGSQPVKIPSGGGYGGSPLLVNLSKQLSFGTYAITLTVENNRTPTKDTEKVTFYVNVEPLQPTVTKPAYVEGPILPKDTGLPNRQTWLFDTATNIEILASSVKMLLITTKGERVMQPNYGTNLRRILFQLNVDAVESVVQQEITTALATWEPRVSVQSLKINRDPNARRVSVQATFTSRTAAAPFDVALSFGS